MRLRAGEILHGRAAAVRGHEPQIGLEAPAQEDARLRVALREHPFDQPVAGEGVRDRGVGARDEEVDVAARLTPTAEAADGDNVGVWRRGAQVLDESGCRLVGLGQQVPAGVLLSVCKCLQDERFLLRAHALQQPQPSRQARRFEILERAHPQVPVEHRHRLWPDPLQVEEIDDARRELGDEFPMELRAAGRGDFDDAGREVLADAGNLA